MSNRRYSKCQSFWALQVCFPGLLQANLAWIVSVFLFYGSLKPWRFQHKPHLANYTLRFTPSHRTVLTVGCFKNLSSKCQHREIKRTAEGLHRILSPFHWGQWGSVREELFLLYGAIPLQQKRDVSEVNWGLEVKHLEKLYSEQWVIVPGDVLDTEQLEIKRIECLAEVACLKMRKAEAANSRKPLLV